MNESTAFSTRSIFDRAGFRTGEFLFVWLAGFSICAIWLIISGYDVNWDLRNYHYYGGYALLTDRFDTDLIPANIQTFLNPLPYVPIYYLITNFSPLVVSLVLALGSGLNFVFLYYLARMLIRQESELRRRILAFGIATGGCTAPIYLSTSTTSFLDGYTSVLILAALFLICRDTESEHRARSWPAFLLVGLLLGVTAGAKLTNMIYALAMTVTLLMLWRSLRMSLRAFGAYALGGTVGALLLHGYWSVFLWTRYDSPVFPYYNKIFRSPFYELVNFRDPRFVPETFLDALAYPWLFLIGAHPSAENYFRDARFALVVIILVVTLLVIAMRRFGGLARVPGARGTVPKPQFHLVVVFCIVSYAVWISTFGISRYFVATELLTLLVVYLLIDHLLPAPRTRFWATIGCIVLAVLTTVPPNWGRISIFSPPYVSDNWFGIVVPPELQASDTLFVMTGRGPSAFMIPKLPPTSKFVRIETNLPRFRQTGLSALARQRIQGHNGLIRSLDFLPIGKHYDKLLADFGLVADDENCVKPHWYGEEFLSCELMRLR